MNINANKKNNISLNLMRSFSIAENTSKLRKASLLFRIVSSPLPLANNIEQTSLGAP